VTPPSDTTPPSASFTASCTGSTCTFTNTSADPDGTFTSSWNFGDQSPASTEASPTHTFAANAATPFTVTLTVTDNGGLTATANQTVTITPEVALSCVNHTGPTDSTADCVLDLNQKTIVTVAVQSTKCEFVGNTFVMPVPAASPADTLFKDGCKVPTGTAYTINGPNPDKSFPASSHVQALFIQGHRKPTDPPKGPPATKVTGSFPDWTVAIDDGGNLGGTGEPNFTDIVLTVHAAAAP
jgi:PKD repeat protein